LSKESAAIVEILLLNMEVPLLDGKSRGQLNHEGEETLQRKGKRCSNYESDEKEHHVVTGRACRLKKNENKPKRGGKNR